MTRAAARSHAPFRLTRLAAGAALLIGLFASLAGAAFDYEPTPSTGPIGSPFYRRLAFDFNLDLRDLVKLEKRGFGREEVVTLVLISKTTGTSVKDYAKRRLKDKVLLKDLAAEAKMDYPTLMKDARAVKEGIEAKGEENLPPPVFEPSPSPEPRRRRKKKGEAEPSPTPAVTASTATATTPVISTAATTTSTTPAHAPVPSPVP